MKNFKNKKIDILGMAEINLNFNTISPKEQWKDRFGKLKTNTFHCHNVHSSTKSTRKFGGNGYISSELASHKIEQYGSRVGLIIAEGPIPKVLKSSGKVEGQEYCEPAKQPGKSKKTNGFHRARDTRTHRCIWHIQFQPDQP